MAKAKTSIAEDAIRSWSSDYELHAIDCLKIRDHNTSAIVPLVFNASQRICNEIAEKLKDEVGYVRIMLLKARRFGGSTWTEGRFYSKASLNLNMNAFIVAHERESTNTLFEMSKLMHQKNPIAPATLHNNEKALKFDNKEGTGLKSEYRVACADNTSAGRSQGVHFLHASEEAFWRDGETLLKGLMQTIPDPPAYSEVVRESTAQGYGNSFQVDCFAAYGEGQHPYYSAKLKDVAPHMPDSDIVFHFAYRAPGQDWVLVFIPWFMHERYTREFDSPQQKLDFATKIGEKVFDNIELQWVESEASKLRRQYGLTLEQLNWREWAIKNKCRDNIRTFREEYPATVEEAFLSTGTNVYPKELCDEIELGCEEPILIGDPLVRGNKTRVRRNPNGKLRIWEVPDKNSQYFMCVDSGGGKNERQKKEKTDPDPTCIDVWNHRSGQQAAQWHGHIEYDMIGDIVEMVGNMFNRCMACVELMNHGYTVVADLKRARYPMFEARPNEPGWLTTAKSKPLMVDDLYRMSRDGQLHIKNKATVSEMRTFKEENGKFNAETGCHDERVDTAGMASQMFQMLPRYITGNEPQGVEFSNLRDRGKREDDGYQEIYTG
jgi:hypothetical protein